MKDNLQKIMKKNKSDWGLDSSKWTEGLQPKLWCAISLEEIKHPQGFSSINFMWLWCD